MRLIAVILLISGIAFAADKVPEPQVELTARLVEIPGKMPSNDIYNYVYVFKYRVIQVTKGELKAKEILVGVYDPRIARGQVKDKMAALSKGTLKEFKAGEVHHLKLLKPLDQVWKDAVEDEYIDDTTERWFALQVDSETK